MVWLSWRKYKALVKDCWPVDVADAAVNARNLDKLIIYSQAAPNKLPEISEYLCHRVQKYCDRRGAAHVAVGVTVACKLMRACSRDLPQLLGSLRALTSFLLRHGSAACNVHGMLLLNEFAEHRHSSTSALLHTFNPDICALMDKSAASAVAAAVDAGVVHAAAINTAVFLVKELCDPSSTITDAVSKQVLGDLIAAVLKHAKPAAAEFSAGAGSLPPSPTSVAAAAFFAEIGAQIGPGTSDLLLPTLFARLRSPPCSGWHNEVAVDVIKHVCERMEERLTHLFVSAFADEVADSVLKLHVTAVKAAARVCLIVQARIRDPANSLPFARLFSVTVDCALHPAWGITASELQPIINKFACRLKSLTRSLEMLHSILERTLKQVPARLCNEALAMVIRCAATLALGGSRGQDAGAVVAAPPPSFSSPRHQAEPTQHALRMRADKIIGLFLRVISSSDSVDVRTACMSVFAACLSSLAARATAAHVSKEPLLSPVHLSLVAAVVFSVSQRSDLSLSDVIHCSRLIVTMATGWADSALLLLQLALGIQASAGDQFPMCSSRVLLAVSLLVAVSAAINWPPLAVLTRNVLGNPSFSGAMPVDLELSPSGLYVCAPEREAHAIVDGSIPPLFTKTEVHAALLEKFSADVGVLLLDYTVPNTEAASSNTAALAHMRRSPSTFFDRAEAAASCRPEDHVNVPDIFDDTMIMPQRLALCGQGHTLPVIVAPKQEPITGVNALHHLAQLPAVCRCLEW